MKERSDFVREVVCPGCDRVCLVAYYATSVECPRCRMISPTGLPDEKNARKWMARLRSKPWFQRIREARGIYE